MIPAVMLNPTWYVIGLGARRLVESIQSDSSTPTADLRNDAERARIKMDVMLNEAKVLQETAIARRIESADEVEIEEFYSVSGKGHAGLKADVVTESVTAGVGAEGMRMTRRVIKFRGGAIESPDYPLTEA
jgi:hypothetical protein